MKANSSNKMLSSVPLWLGPIKGTCFFLISFEKRVRCSLLLRALLLCLWQLKLVHHLHLSRGPLPCPWLLPMPSVLCHTQHCIIIINGLGQKGILPSPRPRSVSILSILIAIPLHTVTIEGKDERKEKKKTEMMSALQLKNKTRKQDLVVSDWWLATQLNSYWCYHENVIPLITMETKWRNYAEGCSL